MHRVYKPPVTPRPFTPGYNPSLGRYISTERELRAAFAEAGRKAGERDGEDHKIVLFDPRDREAAKEMGVTEQGLDATHARRREMGLTDRSTFG